MRVVVTGVAGFIGSNLAKRLLDRGDVVIGIDNLSAGVKENVDERVEFHKVDIRSLEIYPLLEHADAVFHLAAKSSLTDCLANPIEAAEVNAVGTLNVLEAAKKAKTDRFIYASTSSAYEGIKELPASESKIQPIGVYASSKHSGALFCDSYHYLYGMNTVSLRYFNVYGPAQDWRRAIPAVMSGFIRPMLLGKPPVIYGTGEKRRDFIYVDDVNDLHIRLLDGSWPSQRVFNVGTGTAHSINEVYRLIEAQLQTGLEPIYKPDLPGEAQITLADISLARNELGWEPKANIQGGLQRMVRYIQEHAL